MNDDDGDGDYKIRNYGYVKKKRWWWLSSPLAAGLSRPPVAPFTNMV